MASQNLRFISEVVPLFSPQELPSTPSPERVSLVDVVSAAGLLLTAKGGHLLGWLLTRFD